MRQHLKQFAFTVALTLPLVLTAAFTTPFTTTTTAQAGLRMLGPRFPLLVDTNGNGVPDSGDAAANPQLSGNQLKLTSLFSCNNQNNTTADLTAMDGNGKFRTTLRRNNSRDQSITLRNLTGGGQSGWEFTELDPRGVRANGFGNLVDSNGDGLFDSMAITGNINTMLTFVFTPDTNHIGLPAVQMAMLGAKPGKCGLPTVPMVWAPLADTNGDGKGDTIVPDLDGNGVADSQFYSSAMLGAAGVPTTNNIGLSVLTLLLGSIGVWYLGRHRISAGRPQA